MHVWVEGAWRGSEWIAFLLAEPLVAFLSCGRSSQVLRSLTRACLHVFAFGCMQECNLQICCMFCVSWNQNCWRNRTGHVGWRKEGTQKAKVNNRLIHLWGEISGSLDWNLNFYTGPYFSNIKEVESGWMACNAEKSWSRGTDYEWCDPDSRILE